MKKLVDKRSIKTMTLIATIVYFTSYITRINYAAVIVEITKIEGITKSAASLVTTTSFITYGIGQLVSGYLGDQIPPKLLIFFGLITTSVMNFLLPLCRGISGMSVVWAMNGFAQAMLWPPLVKIMVDIFRAPDYRRASVKVSWGSSFGTIAVYLFAPFCVISFGWQSVFYIPAVLSVIVAGIWLIVCAKMEKRAVDITEDALSAEGKSASIGVAPKDFAIVFLIMMIILFMGALRDGIKTWMPSYLSEIYHLSSFTSILSGVLLPVFAIGCFQLTLWLHQNFIKNELECAGYIFATGFVAALLLFLTLFYNVALSVFMSAVIIGSMSGVNLMLISLVPPCLTGLGRVSLVSGVLNFSAYAGSAVSTYGIALIAEKAGWRNAILFWVIIAFIGTSACFISKNKWERFKKISRPKPVIF